MIEASDDSRGRAVIARWCALAEQRLDYLIELYESGRWRRYHSESDFLDNIREAKTAAATWRQLATMEATADNRPVDWSWLGRERVAPPPHPAAPVAVADVTALPAPAESPESSPAASPEPSPAVVDVQDDTAPAEVPDLLTIEERYPILRSVLRSTDAVRAA